MLLPFVIFAKYILWLKTIILMLSLMEQITACYAIFCAVDCLQSTACWPAACCQLPVENWIT
jgi:hypothetical protein